MKTKHDQFAVSMAKNVRDVERRVDDVLAAAGDMLQNFAEGRRGARLAAEVGQEALEKFTEFTHLTAKARGVLVGCHASMAADGARMNMTWDDDMDPYEGKPPPGEKETPKTLREHDVVA
jgi:hypothetical protein